MANTIVVDILADTRSLVKGVNETNAKLGQLNQAASKVTSAFKGIVGALGLSIGISWFKDAIKAAEEEEKTFAALATLYGKDADAIIAKVGNLSKLFYVDDGTIAQLVIDLKGALRAELDPLADELAEAAIVLAKLTNKPLEEISGKLVKFLKDGKLTVKEIQGLGISLTEEQQKAFDAAVKAGTEVQFILDLLLSEENKKKALGLTTPFEKLTFTLNEIKDLVGGKLLKIFEKLFAFFTDEGADGITKTNNNFKSLKEIVILLTGAFVAYKIAITAALIVDKLRKATQTMTLAQAALNFVMTANPIGLVILAIAAVIAIIILMKNNWESVTKVFDKVAETVANVIKGIVNTFKKLFKDLDLVTPFKQMISNVLGFLGGLGSTFYGMGKSLIQGLINGIGGMIGQAVQKVKDLASNVTGAIKNFFKIGSPSKVFAGFGANLVQGLANGIDKANGLAVSSVRELSSNLIMPMSLSPAFVGAGSSSRQPITVNINAGVGTDPYELGRVVRAALDKYAGVNG